MIQRSLGVHLIHNLLTDLMANICMLKVDCFFFLSQIYLMACNIRTMTRVVALIHSILHSHTCYGPTCLRRRLSHEWFMMRRATTLLHQLHPVYIGIRYCESSFRHGLFNFSISWIPIRLLWIHVDHFGDKSSYLF